MNTKKLTALAVTLVILIGTLLSLCPILAAAETSSLPTAFPASSDSLDYTDMPYSTAVKDQASYGMCWAFAAVACAEADAIKNHGADKDSIDLSEWHLAYFAYHGEREGTGDSVSLSGEVPYYNIGGFEELSALALASGIGFVDEAMAPFDTLLADSTATLGSYLMNHCDYRIRDVMHFDIASDPEAVKAAVYEYGAVAVNCYSGVDYITSSGSAQYCGDTSKKADHAVTIVGWDDDYSRYNFSFENALPRSNGAWLVKNSWGEEFGHNGYFWISYEDVTLEGGAAFDVVRGDTYDRIYQHDGGITTHYIPLSDGEQIETVNIFTADARNDEILTSVGVAVADVATTNEYTLRIYGSPEYSDGDGLTYKRLLLTQTGYFHEGYNTIPLDRLIELKPGDVFAVSITTGAGLMVDATVPSNPDEPEELAQKTYYSSTAYVGEGQTVYKENSDAWKDAANDGTPWNSRIKAHTLSVSDRVRPRVASMPEIGEIEYGQPLSEAELIPGVVLDTTGTEVTGTWSFRDESLVPSDGDLVYIIFTPDDLTTYETVTEALRVSVSEPPPEEADTENDSDETSQPNEPDTSTPDGDGNGTHGGSDLAQGGAELPEYTQTLVIALGAVGVAAILAAGIAVLAVAAVLVLVAATTAVVIVIVIRKKRK